MNEIARKFFLTAVAYGILGLGLGLHMAISQDHGQLPVHAHIMVIGWLSFVVFGFFYHYRRSEHVSRLQEARIYILDWP